VIQSSFGRVTGTFARRRIYFWARDEIGVRAPMAGVIVKGETGPSGVTYAIAVANNGVQGRGVTRRA
jgi:hypothetical protein